MAYFVDGCRRFRPRYLSQRNGLGDSFNKCDSVHKMVGYSCYYRCGSHHVPALDFHLKLVGSKLVDASTCCGFHRHQGRIDGSRRCRFFDTLRCNMLLIGDDLADFHSTKRHRCLHWHDKNQPDGEGRVDIRHYRRCAGICAVEGVSVLIGI